MRHHLSDLLARSDIVPAVNQVELQVAGVGSAARKGVRELGDLRPIQGVVRTDVVSRR